MGRFRFPLSVTLAVGSFAAGAEPPLDLRPEKRQGAISSAEPGLEFLETHALFEDSYQFGELRHVFPFRNQSAKTITVEQSMAVGGDAKVEVVPQVLVPGGTGEARVVQPLGDKLGSTAFRYALITDEPGVARYRFSLSGFVESAYDPEIVRFDFGRVERRAGALAELELSSREVERLEVLKVLDQPSWLELLEIDRASDAGQGLRLRARLRENAPLGRLQAKVQLLTNVSNQERVTVAVGGEVWDDILPNEHPVAFGAVKLGDGGRATLRLRSRSGQAFAIAAASDPDGRVVASHGPCPEAPADTACQRLELEVGRALPATDGPFHGRILVEIVGLAEVLPITYTGLWVNPATPIKQIDIGDPRAGGF